MTSLTHRLPVLHLSAPAAGPRTRGSLLRLISRLYADRPVGAQRPSWYAAELPSQRYADLTSLSLFR